MKNIAVLILCALLFTQCSSPDVAVYPAGNFDTLGVNWMTIDRGNVTYYFQGTGLKAASLYTDIHEDGYLQLNRVFNAQLPQKLRFFVWTDRTIAEQRLGYPLGFALPQRCQCQTYSGQTLGHEMTHVLAFWAWDGIPPASRSRFINEGLAVAFDLSGRDYIAEAKKALKGQNISTALDIWKNEDQASEEVLYPVGGAFMDFLYRKNQPGKFKIFIKNQAIQDAEEIYGKDGFASLMAEFDDLLGL